MDSLRPSWTFHPYFRSVRHEEKIEDSNYLRRNHSFYVHLLNDVAGHEEVKSLFSGSFYSKVLNAVAMTRDNLVKDSILMWNKSPCVTASPKVTNVWKKSSGFRKGLFSNLWLKRFF